VGCRYISRFFETFPDFFRKVGRFLAQESEEAKGHLYCLSLLLL
jgi:hypothetical protein